MKNSTDAKLKLEDLRRQAFKILYDASSSLPFLRTLTTPGSPALLVASSESELALTISWQTTASIFALFDRTG